MTASKNSRAVNFRVSLADEARLRAFAAAANRTLTDQIRFYINHGLEACQLRILDPIPPTGRPRRRPS